MSCQGLIRDSYKHPNAYTIAQVGLLTIMAGGIFLSMKYQWVASRTQLNSRLIKKVGIGICATAGTLSFLASGFWPRRDSGTEIDLLAFTAHPKKAPSPTSEEITDACRAIYKKRRGTVSVKADRELHHVTEKAKPKEVEVGPFRILIEEGVTHIFRDSECTCLPMPIHIGLGNLSFYSMQATQKEFLDENFYYIRIKQDGKQYHSACVVSYLYQFVYLCSKGHPPTTQENNAKEILEELKRKPTAEHLMQIVNNPEKMDLLRAHLNPRVSLIVNEASFFEPSLFPGKEYSIPDFDPTPPFERPFIYSHFEGHYGVLVSKKIIKKLT